MTGSGRKRVFVAGLVAFTVASARLRGGAEPTVLALARAVQGVGGAFLVPGSLAIIAAELRGARTGLGRSATWSGLAAISAAVGPFLGGWLVDAASWRWVFFINVPIAAVDDRVTVGTCPRAARRRSGSARPGRRGPRFARSGGACWALIQGPPSPSTPARGRGARGRRRLAAFLVRGGPPLASDAARSRCSVRAQFSGANGTTLAVYAALGAAFFMIVLELQLASDYSALESGAALLPITVLMLTLSRRVGALAQRIGPRLPMTVGPVARRRRDLAVHPGPSRVSTT